MSSKEPYYIYRGFSDFEVPAIIYAAFQNEIDLLKNEIDKGIDLNIRDRDGYTALCWAAEKGHNEIIKLLLDAGADPSLSGEGWPFYSSPLQASLMNSGTETLEFFIDQITSEQTLNSLLNRKISISQFVLLQSFAKKRGYKINAKLLHLISDNLNPNTYLKKILEKIDSEVFNMNHYCQNGFTAAAVYMQNPSSKLEVLKLLENKGSNLLLLTKHQESLIRILYNSHHYNKWEKKALLIYLQKSGVRYSPVNNAKDLLSKFRLAFIAWV